MALIIEDGTVVSGAQSYVSVADLDTYAATRDDVTLPATDAGKETILLEAMDYLHTFAGMFKGDRVDIDQELDWPRRGAWIYGFLNPYDSIPRDLTAAQILLAVMAIDNELTPTSVGTDKGPVIEETVHGAVTVRYANNGKVLPVAFNSSVMAHINELIRHNGLTIVRK